MLKVEKTYTTTLEKASDKDDLLAILDAKAVATTPERVADYMELATDNIKGKIDALSDYIKELQAIKKQEVNRFLLVGEKCAEWLEGSGVEKLEGLHVSSITINKTEPKENLIIEDEELLIKEGYFKKVLCNTKVKIALEVAEEAGVEFKGAKIEVIRLANKITVNKKRK